MIKNFSNKDLEKAYKHGDYSSFPTSQQKAIQLVLQALDTARVFQDCDLPGKRLHSHKSTKKQKHKVWSLDVGKKDRIFFKFKDGEVFDVNYGDPH